MINTSSDAMIRRPDDAAERIALRRHQPSRRCQQPGFTIVELLVAVGLIILIISILIVAVSAASRTALRTRTSTLMDSIRKSLIQFKSEVGYIPPVLGVAYTPTNPTGNPTMDELRRLFPNSVPNPTVLYSGGASFSAHMQEYFSTCTLADYLIGYGPDTQDGWGNATNERPHTGIRHPGDDGVWSAMSYVGAAPPADLGSIAQRRPTFTGKRLGPFFELTDERLLAAVRYGPNGLETYFPGDELPAGLTWDAMPKAIVDYWGQPIRYYRRPYPAGAISQSYRPVGNTRVPTLADVFVLRPWELPPNSDMNGVADALGDTAITPELSAAEFALLSTGPDKQWAQAVRRDDQPSGPHSNAYNADNIVELGP